MLNKNFVFCCIILSLASCALNFIGCATAPLGIPVQPTGIQKIYHRAEKGQTLWRISKIYNVDLDELIKLNHISDITNIEIGQLIFIPSQRKQIPVFNKSLAEDFIWPVKGKVIAAFGETFNGVINKGLNIKAYGNSETVAARNGKVVFYADGFPGYGKTIIIDHGDGFLSVYAGNSEVFVKTGDIIRKGTTIAKTGTAGRDKNAYLHFEIRKGHTPQNPYFYLPN